MYVAMKYWFDPLQKRSQQHHADNLFRRGKIALVTLVTHLMIKYVLRSSNDEVKEIRS